GQDHELDDARAREASRQETRELSCLVGRLDRPFVEGPWTICPTRSVTGSSATRTGPPPAHDGDASVGACTATPPKRPLYGGAVPMERTWRRANHALTAASSVMT